LPLCVDKSSIVFAIVISFWLFKTGDLSIMIRLTVSIYFVLVENPKMIGVFRNAVEFRSTTIMGE